MKTTFTRDEVEKILVSLFVYSLANHNHGLNNIDGRNFGEQAVTVIEANESIINTNKSLLAVLPLLEKRSKTKTLNGWTDAGANSYNEESLNLP